jgi:hypothetical protein
VLFVVLPLRVTSMSSSENKFQGFLDRNGELTIEQYLTQECEKEIANLTAHTKSAADEFKQSASAARSKIKQNSQQK